jgi:hypothetical protein
MAVGGGNQSTRRKPQTCRKSLTNFITLCCIEYISPSAGFKFTTLVVIGTQFKYFMKIYIHDFIFNKPCAGINYFWPKERKKDNVNIKYQYTTTHLFIFLHFVDMKIMKIMKRGSIQTTIHSGIYCDKSL